MKVEFFYELLRVAIQPGRNKIVIQFQTGNANGMAAPHDKTVLRETFLKTLLKGKVLK